MKNLNYRIKLFLIIYKVLKKKLIEENGYNLNETDY